MTNRNLFLLLGTSLSFLPQTISAQCVSPIQDCYALGYTQTSCPNGKGVKCPFGSEWYCGGTAAQDCLKLGYDKDCTGAGESGSGETCNGKYKTCTCSSPYTWSGSTCTCPSTYKYTCSGAGYSGGSGAACNGKYTSCICASGYEWKDSSCQISNPCYNQGNGAYSEVYCCNGTVVGVRATGMNFYVAMNDLGKMIWNSANSQCSSYVFCSNINGTLPSSDQLATIHNNKSLLNNLLSTNEGTKIAEDWPYWSSTIYDDYHYGVSISNGDPIYWGYDGGILYVRPILTSW